MRIEGTVKVLVVVPANDRVEIEKGAAEEFRSQLVLGAPNNADEAALRRLSAQLKAKKLVEKLFLRYRLHAKLYLIHRIDPNNPATGFLGSSTLRLSRIVQARRVERRCSRSGCALGTM
jgi:hypothetical protein